MLNETDELGWTNALDLNKMPVFFRLEYINAVKEAFKVKVQYYLYKKNDVISAAIAVFVKNGSAIMPEHFSYTPFWVSGSLDERKRIDTISHVLRSLKASFRKINLKLGIDFTDIRPFIWEGFEIENRYTYIKDTSTIPHKSIVRNLGNAAVKSFSSIVGLACKDSIQLNTALLNRLGSPVKKIENYLHILSASNNLYSIDLYKNQQHLASNLVLLNKEYRGRAFLLFASPVNRSEKYAHTFLYQEMFNWLLREGYSEIDLCGANMEGIAKFKSFFNPELKPYYIVRYSALKKRLQPLLKLVDRI